MSDEDKVTQGKRRAMIYDVVVLMLASCLFLQVAIPALIPLVEASKDPVVPVVASKAVPK